jgi:hypothetical protein
MGIERGGNAEYEEHSSTIEEKNSEMDRITGASSSGRFWFAQTLGKIYL